MGWWWVPAAITAVGSIAGASSQSRMNQNQAAWNRYNAGMQYGVDSMNNMAGMQIGMMNAGMQMMSGRINAAIALEMGRLNARLEKESAIQNALVSGEVAAYNASLIHATTLYNDSLMAEELASMWDAMDLDVALAFLVNESKQELELIAYRGVSQEFVQGLQGLKVGEGFNGRVVKTGQPFLVANVTSDPLLTRQVVRQEGIITQLVVPLKSKDKVVGTLSVAGHYARVFKEEEIDLLTTIGRQVGFAIDNSQLYEHERQHAEEQKELQEILRYYLRQVTRAQEEERQRIAQELHDDTIQDLVLLLHNIDRFSSTADFLPPAEILFLEELRQRIRVISDEVRRFTQDLRPSVLDDLGLLPALEWLAQDVSKHFEIKVTFSSSGEVRHFDQETKLTIFRMVQESLRNVWKHSDATEAHIRVEFTDKKSIFIVEDNGLGFKLPERVEDLAQAGKLGLVGMQERAQLINARLLVQSEPGKGTSIIIELPGTVGKTE